MNTVVVPINSWWILQRQVELYGQKKGRDNTKSAISLGELSSSTFLLT